MTIKTATVAGKKTVGKQDSDRVRQQKKKIRTEHLIDVGEVGQATQTAASKVTILAKGECDTRQKGLWEVVKKN